MIQNISEIEKALLVGIAKEKSWNVMILNSITEDYFSYENKALYKYLKDCSISNKFPELPLLQFEYNITDDEMMTYTEIDDLDGLCKVIKKDYFKRQIEYELGNLNEDIEKGLVTNDPNSFVEKLGLAQTRLKQIGYTNKAVGLLDNIDEILKIDPNDVITTGFKELNDILVGWKRGEELVTIVGRTGQGKSWLGLKFALAAALTGERVGIYSGEMSRQQLQERILCCAKQTYTSTREEALQFLKDNNIDIRVLTQAELRRRANIDDLESFILTENLTFLIVDQLSLVDDITSKPNTPLRQQYGNISMDIFSLSSKYNLATLLLAQSNRQGGQEAGAPSLEHIAESDAVAQNSTRVITMRNENGVLTLNIVKNRYGASGQTLKYECDYGINKYKLIRDLPQQANAIKKVKARNIFGGSTF